MTAWQDIETAPKDGTWVLLFCDGKQLVSHWGRHSPSMTESAMGWVWGYREDYFGEHVHWYGEPTHWQPLPKPPPNHRSQSI